jgi:hypothetical protein
MRRRRGAGLWESLAHRAFEASTKIPILRAFRVGDDHVRVDSAGWGFRFLADCEFQQRLLRLPRQMTDHVELHGFVSGAHIVHPLLGTANAIRSNLPKLSNSFG